MKITLKKIISLFLSMITFFMTGSINHSYASAETRSMVASGFCGLYGDNLKCFLYSDGELIINGNGEMDWYYVEHESNGKETSLSSPWSKYYEDINIITIEEGVTSIGNDAFIWENIKYNRINLPKSLEFFEGNIFNLIKHYQTKGKHIAFCYAGSESEWDAVECMYYQIEFDEESQNYERILLDTSCANRIEHTGFEDFQKMYFNGDEPISFCEIKRTTSTVTVNPLEKVELYAHYYFKESDNAKLIWSIKGDGVMLQERTNKTKSTLETYTNLFVYGKATVKLELVSSNGTVLNYDEISINSSIQRDFSFGSMIEKRFIQVFLLLYITVVGVWGGTVGPWIGSYLQPPKFFINLI